MNAALLLTALFNGAWQGGALCLLALLAFRMFRRLNAATMFAVWSVLLGIAVLLPAANYAFATKPYVVVQHAPSNVVSVPTGSAVVRQAHYHEAVNLRHFGPAARQHDALAFTAIAASVLRYSWAILAMLAVIALFRLAMLMHDVVRMLLSRRRVRPIESPVRIPGEIGRPFGYAASDEFSSPCVLGFAPALIVIPEELLMAQDGAELTSVVLHEREHVRRFDDVQNVLHRLIGAIAFFCPGVRVALRELALYREQICDDAAVNATGDRVRYAMMLTGLSQWAQGKGAPVPSLVFKRKQLMHRLEVLLDSAVSHSLRMNRRFAFVAAFALVLAAMIVLRVQVPVIAQTVVPAPPASIAQKVHVQMKKMRAQVRQMHAQVQQVRRQVVKIHSQLNAARMEMYPIRTHNAPTLTAMIPVPMAPAVMTVPRIGVNSSGDLLDALDRAGLHNLSVDDLIAIRDHGVTPELVRSATSYFGHVGAKDLVYLADHGVAPNYIDALTASGVRGISPHDAAGLMDHGVTSSLISAATAYFGRASAEDLTRLADHGVTGVTLQGFKAAGLPGVSVNDIVRLFDNGVDAPYVAKVRRMNPRASIDDIIRLRNSGF